MAMGLVRGAALGAVAGELLTAILSAKDKVYSFRSFFEKLRSTLEIVIPKIEEIKRLDGELNDRRRSDIDNLIAELKKGKGLVRKCSKIQSWNYYQKYQYSKRLLQLDEYLVRFFGLNVQAEIWCDAKQLLVDVQEANRKLDQLKLVESGVGSRNGNGKEPEKKKEMKKKEEPKKEEKKKEEKNEQTAELVKAYIPYSIPTYYYYVESAEENPNSCVIC